MNLRVEFPYDTGNIHRRLMVSANRHASSCREEIVRLRAALAKHEQRIVYLETKLSHYERRNDHTGKT